jgi:hypothetical protein
MAFVNEVPSAEDFEKCDLPYKLNLERPIEHRIKMTMDRERGIYLPDGGPTGNQAFEDHIKTRFYLYLAGTKFEIIMEPCHTPGDFQANPYYIHWPELLEISVIQPKENRMVEVFKTVCERPNEPQSLLNNYSFNQFVAILKEALTVQKAGYYNRYIHAPITVSFGFGEPGFELGSVPGLPT